MEYQRIDKLDDKTLRVLIDLSKDWESENSCYGYRANTKEDIDGRIVFILKDQDKIVGYLFGKIEVSENSSSVMPKDTPHFEAEELYIIPELRDKGLGKSLFKCAEDSLKKEVPYILLSTATKNYQAILNFYIKEVGMTFWNARLFKKIED